MSAPKGPASTSELLLPSPSVVVGDVMRDSTGAPATLSVIGFDANGQPIPGLTPTFAIVDSIKFAHFDPSGVLVGDSLGDVHIVGQLASVQTPVATVHVTVAPTSITATAVGTDSVPFTNDTTLAKFPVGAVIAGANGAFPVGFVVRFALLYAPATRAGKSAAVSLRDDRDSLSTADTTTTGGQVSRSVAVVVPFLADDSLIASKKGDSIVVGITASYKGAPIPGSPIRVVVPLFVKPAGS